PAATRSSTYSSGTAMSTAGARSSSLSAVTRTIMTAPCPLSMPRVAGCPDGHGARPPVDGADAGSRVSPQRRRVRPLPRPQPLVRIVPAHLLDERLIDGGRDRVIDHGPCGGDDLGGARPHQTG